MRAILTVLVLVGGCSVEGHFETPEWSLERMLEQPRADAYESSAYFVDRRVLRPLPEGVVATSAEIGPPEVVEGRTASGEFVESIPIPTSMALLEEGRRHFHVFCATCHGRLGDGRSKVAPYMELQKPVSFHTDEHRSMPPGRLFATITRGVGLMPSYAVELDVRERWAVVAYVKALELSRHAEVAALPRSVRRELEREAAP